MTNRKCKLSSILWAFWRTIGLCVRCPVGYCWLSSLSLFFFFLIKFLKSRQFPRNKSPRKSLWYLNFVCFGPVYVEIYTWINVVCLITFVCVIGINFEWVFGGFFKGFSRGFVLSRIYLFTKKKDINFIKCCILYNPNSIKKKDLTQIFFDGWIVKYWFIHFMRSLHFGRFFFLFCTSEAYLSKICGALWFVYKSTSSECLEQCTKSKYGGIKPNRQFRFMSSAFVGKQKHWKTHEVGEMRMNAQKKNWTDRNKLWGEATHDAWWIQKCVCDKC